MISPHRLRTRTIRLPLRNVANLHIAALVRLGLTSADEIEHRATSALVTYVGGQALLKLNLRDAVVLAREIESEQAAALRLAEGAPGCRNG